MDYEGIKVLLDRAKVLFPRLAHLWMDGGYTGEDKGADWVRKAFGWSVEIVADHASRLRRKCLWRGLGSGPKRA
jgi:hypothetical protein